MTLRVPAEERHSLRQGTAVLGRRQVRQQVEHDLGDGHARTPTLDSVGRGEAQPDLDDAGRRDPRPPATRAPPWRRPTSNLPRGPRRAGVRDARHRHRVAGARRAPRRPRSPRRRPRHRRPTDQEWSPTTDRNGHGASGRSAGRRSRCRDATENPCVDNGPRSPSPDRPPRTRPPAIRRPCRPAGQFGAVPPPNRSTPRSQHPRRNHTTSSQLEIKGILISNQDQTPRAGKTRRGVRTAADHARRRPGRRAPGSRRRR